MADVTGTIGNEHVELNNAATEATLKLLLHSSLAANKQSIENIKNLAEKSGIDPETLRATELAFAGTTRQTDLFKASIYEASRVVGALSPVLQKITQGTGQASDLLHGMANAAGGIPVVGGVISAVVSGFAMLAKVQEEWLLTFESLGKSGANFNGSLGAMRLSASNAYLTLDQFSRVVKSNQEVFSSMGGDVQKGVDNFVRIQNTLLAPGSMTSKNLGFLGVSAEEAAELTTSYIRSQGTMNKMNLQDTSKVSAAVGQYAQELTVLSELTGKSREELQKKLDQENTEAQYQNFLAQLDEKTAAKFRKGLEAAMVQGGQPAMDAFKSLAMGFPPMTKAAQLYAATQQAGYQSLQQMTDTAKNSSISLDEASVLNRKALAHAIVGGAKELDSFRNVLRAGGLTQSELTNTLSAAQQIQTKMMKDGKMLSEAEIEAKLASLAAEKERDDGTAVSAQQTQRQLQQLGQEILTKLMPILEYFQAEINANAGTITSFIKEQFIPTFMNLANGAKETYKYLKENADKLKTWGMVIGGLIGTMALLSAVTNAAIFAEKAKSAAGSLLYGTLGTRARPMYVWVANPGGIGGSRPNRFGAGTAKAGASAAEAAAEGGAKAGGKAVLGKTLGKLLPGAGLAFGAYDSYERFKGGDLLGGGIAATSGLASLIPGFGTAAALALDAVNIGRDLAKSSTNDKKEEGAPKLNEIPSTSSATDPVEKLNKAVETLNSHMVDIKNYIRQTADNTQRTARELYKVHGDVWPGP